MTVKELIEELQKLDPEAKVVHQFGDVRYARVDEVYELAADNLVCLRTDDEE